MSAEHMVTTLGVALLDACELLEEAKCPRPNCIGGVVRLGLLRENWHKCQWCADKKALIDEHG